MVALLQAFATQNFDTLYTKMNDDSQREFLNVLMAVVHSHRHNKGEETPVE